MLGVLHPRYTDSIRWNCLGLAKLSDGVHKWVINLTEGVMTCYNDIKDCLPDAVVTAPTGSVTHGKHSLEAHSS